MEEWTELGCPMSIIFKSKTVQLDAPIVIRACKLSGYINRQYNILKLNSIVLKTNEFTSFVVETILDYFKSDSDPHQFVKCVFTQYYEEIFSFILAIDFLEINELFEECTTKFFTSFSEFSSAEKLRAIFHIQNPRFDSDEEEYVKEEIEYALKEEKMLGDNVSIYIDHKKTCETEVKGHLFHHLKPRKSVFLDDQEVKCSKCSMMFTKLWRSHHCRVCSRIFCDKCVKYMEVPETCRSYNPSTNLWGYATSFYRSGKEPVCYSCELDVTDQIPLVSSAFVTMGLTIDILKKAATVCLVWRRASIKCLDTLRKIQYHFLTHVLTKNERRLLWNNRMYWTAHDKWLVQLIKAVEWDNPKHAEEMLSQLSISIPSISCWEAMCTSRCRKSNMVEPERALELLSKEVVDLRAREYAVKCLQETPVLELICYLPLLVHNLRYEPIFNSPSMNFLIERALVPDHVQFRTELYWSLTLASEDSACKRMYDLYKDLLIASITEKLGSLESKQILKGLELVAICENLKSSPVTARAQLAALTSVSLPLQATIKSLEFYSDKIDVKESATAPLVIPCLCINTDVTTTIDTATTADTANVITDTDTDTATTTATTDTDTTTTTATTTDTTTDTNATPFLYKMMFKFEDLRKDQLVMNLISRSNQILHQNNLNYSLLTYRVLPTGINSGMLQIIQNSTTFYTIDKDYQDLWHFLRIENFDGQLSARVLSNHFFKSAAVYSVISFLLNVGDRHLDNIMVTSDGHCFHIDYGFILGEEPVFKKALGAKNPVRIPQKMKDTIEGASVDGKEAFDKFIKMCSEIYLVLRKHYSLFMNLLSLLHLAQPKIEYQFTLEHVEQELNERFLPGISDEVAREAFERVIANCGENMINFLTDMGHDFKRQKPFDKVQEAAAGVVYGVFGMVWGLQEAYAGSGSVGNSSM